MTRWDTLARFGGAIHDTVLLMPYLVTVERDRAYVFDYGDLRAKAVDLDGGMLWSHGGRGEGPGEFINPFDLELDDTLVWVLDEGAGRVTLLDRETGAYVRQVPLHQRFFRDVIPMSGGRFLGLLVGPGDAFIAELDSLGSVIRTAPYPTRALRSADYLLRMPMSAVAARNDPGPPLWAALFPHGADLLVYRGADLVCRGRRVAARPMDHQSGPRPSVSAADIALADTTVLVLAADAGGDRLRTVDVYDARDCRYLRSYRLPVRATAIAASGGRLLVQHDEPAPGLLLLQPEAPEAP